MTKQPDIGGGTRRHDDGGGNGLGIGIGQPAPALSTSERHGVFSFQERAGKPGGGKGILIQHEHTGALSTLNNQSVLDGNVHWGQGQDHSM